MLTKIKFLKISHVLKLRRGVSCTFGCAHPWASNDQCVRISGTNFLNYKVFYFLDIAKKSRGSAKPWPKTSHIQELNECKIVLVG